MSDIGLSTDDMDKEMVLTPRQEISTPASNAVDGDEMQVPLTPRQEISTCDLTVPIKPDLTINELPWEMLEIVLMDSVIAELRASRLRKDAWEARSQVITSILADVCPRWHAVVTTKIFRDRLTKALHKAVPESIRFDLIDRIPMNSKVVDITSVHDDVYFLCKPQVGQHMLIDIYDRREMTQIKRRLHLIGLKPICMAGSYSSNSCFVLNKYSDGVLNICRFGKDTKDVSEFMYLTSLPATSNAKLSVTHAGQILVCSQLPPNPANLHVYDSDGLLLHQINLPYGTNDFLDMIPSPNGNILILSHSSQLAVKTTEIDMNGKIIFQRQSAISANGAAIFDRYGTLVLVTRLKRMEVCDHQLNLIASNDPSNSSGFSDNSPAFDPLQHLPTPSLLIHTSVRNLFHYHKEREELFWLNFDKELNNTVLTVFRLRDV